MIKSQEQYEEIKRDVKFDISTAHEKDMLETIEALREVARAASDIDIEYEMRLGMWIVQGEPYQAEALHNALDAIPDWLTEEES